jgi:ketosteroid isomerase-like protein
MTNDIEKMIKDWAAAWNSHDLDKIISFYTDDCVLEDNGLGVVCHGKKELVAFCKSSLIDVPDVRFESKSLFNTGNWARARATGPSWKIRSVHADRLDETGS